MSSRSHSYAGSRSRNVGDAVGAAEGDVLGAGLGLAVGAGVGFLVSNVSNHAMHCPSLHSAATHFSQSTKEKQHAAHAVHASSSSEQIASSALLTSVDAASAGEYNLSSSVTSWHQGPYCAFSGSSAFTASADVGQKSSASEQLPCNLAHVTSQLSPVSPRNHAGLIVGDVDGDVDGATVGDDGDVDGDVDGEAVGDDDGDVDGEELGDVDGEELGG